jgi:hypothetical protein
VEAVIARAAEVMQEEPDAYATQREHLASEAQRLSEAIKNLTVAVESGACLAPLVEALKDRQRERADVLARLEHLEGLATAVTWDEDTLTELRARLVEWDGLLSSEPVMARPDPPQAAGGALDHDTEGHAGRSLLRGERAGDLWPDYQRDAACTKCGAPGVARTALHALLVCLRVSLPS